MAGPRLAMCLLGPRWAWVVVLCLVALLDRVESEASATMLGGHQVDLRYYPHQVAVIVKKGADEVSCGGSILSNLFVLTAAHCMELAGFGPGESAVAIDSQITVRYGHEDWLLGDTAAVDRVWVHPEYEAAAGIQENSVGMVHNLTSTGYNSTAMECNSTLIGFNATGTTECNATVTEYNSMVTEYNSTVTEYNATVAGYNWTEMAYNLTAGENNATGTAALIGMLKEHDVAVIRVSSANPIAYSKRARPIKLAPVDSKLTLGADVTIAGWGLGASAAASGVVSPARSLKATTVNSVPQMCGLDSVWGSEFDGTTMLCAGCDTAQADACDGDDGGALTSSSASGGCAIVVGIASRAVCGESTLKPSVYTRVAPHVAWIESIVGHPVRSTYDLAPRTDCDKCVNPSNPPPCGNAPATVDRYRCHVEGALAQGFKLSFGAMRCVNGKTRLKAEFTGEVPDIPGGLKKGVVYLLSAASTGTEVLYMHGMAINTPLSAPISRLAKAKYKPRKKGWDFKVDGCPTDGTTYAALYRSRGSYGYFQISLPIQ